MQMPVQLQERLARIEDQWLLWNSAFLQDDFATAGEAANDIHFTVDDLGLVRLPDIAHGMVARAVDAAREGQFERASWALEHAELIDPGSPEVAFASGRVKQLQGRWLASMADLGRGYLRVLGDDPGGFLLLQNLLLWAVFVLSLSAAGFVAIELAAKGGRVYRDLAGLLGRVMPVSIALVVALVAVIWLFLLPNAWIWLVVVWSILLWRYLSTSERGVVIGLCFVLALAPGLVLLQKRDVRLMVSDPVRAMDAIIEGELYGELMVDLRRLAELLPDSIAARQFLADSYVQLGLDGVARPLYREVLEAEPGNVAALNNLGVFHLRRREHFRAFEFFEQAADQDPATVVPRYNLSLAYRELLEFDLADRYLAEARQRNPEQVAGWVTRSVEPLPLWGGFGRRDEVSGQLQAVWMGPSSGRLAEAVINVGWAPLVLLVPFLGFAVERWWPGVRTGPHPVGDGIDDRLVRWLLPGLGAAEEDDGVRAYLGILIPLGALCLPLLGEIGYRIPWAYDPGNRVAWTAAIGVVAIIYLVRIPALLR